MKNCTNYKVDTTNTDKLGRKIEHKCEVCGRIRINYWLEAYKCCFCCREHLLKYENDYEKALAMGEKHKILDEKGG